MKSDARPSRRPCARRLNAARGKTAAQNRTEARRQECRSCANPGNALRRRPTSGGWPKPDCHFRPVPRLPPNRGPLYASRLARQNRPPSSRAAHAPARACRPAFSSPSPSCFPPPLASRRNLSRTSHWQICAVSLRSAPRNALLPSLIGPPSCAATLPRT